MRSLIGKTVLTQGRRGLPLWVYLGVRVDFMRWDNELEDGVLLSWCSGVVRGPSMLTATYRHYNETSNQQTTVPRLIQALKNNTQSLASSYFSQGWHSSLRSRWSGDPSLPARFLPSQTGPSNPPAEPRDAPQPEQKGISKNDRGYFAVLPHHISTVPSQLCSCLRQDRGGIFMIILCMLMCSIIWYTAFLWSHM